MLLLLSTRWAFLIEENIEEMMNDNPSEPKPIDFEAYSRIFPHDSLFDSSTLRQFKRTGPVGGLPDFNKVKRSLQLSGHDVFGEKIYATIFSSVLLCSSEIVTHTFQTQKMLVTQV